MSNARGRLSPLPDAPWSGLPRADNRDALTRAALNYRDGAPLTVLAQKAFGEDAVTGGANYQLARRLYRRHGDLFKTARRHGYVWVEPTTTLCQRASLDTASKHTVGTQDCDGVAMSNAEAMLQRRQTFEGLAERGDLVGAFGAKREATEDRFHVLQDTFDPESHRLIPYSTRFNSVGRVRETWDRYQTAWRRAADEYREGVVVTLTTDPGRYDSLAGMCDNLLGDVNALKDWVAYDPESGPARAGHRPPSVVSVEFTDDGKPHVHVAFFGVRWLAEHSALSRYWSDSRDRGRVVWIDRIRTQSSQWVWVPDREDRQHTDIGGAAPRGYLGESIYTLAMSADTSATEVQETAAALRSAGDDTDDTVSETDTSGLLSTAMGGDGNTVATDGGGLREAESGGEISGRDVSDEPGERAYLLFKAALYWTTGLPAVTISPALKPDDDREGDAGRVAPDGTVLPMDAPSRWRYLGTAQYHELPGYIRKSATVNTRNGATVRGQPPPDRP